jgi:hypothetical protein
MFILQLLKTLHDRLGWQIFCETSHITGKQVFFPLLHNDLQNGFLFVLSPNLSVWNNLNSQNKNASTTNSKNSDSKSDNPLPPELEHCDKALVEKIEAEIVHTGQVVTFEEIAGLEFAKKCVNELICW